MSEDQDQSPKPNLKHFTMSEERFEKFEELARLVMENLGFLKEAFAEHRASSEQRMQEVKIQAASLDRIGEQVLPALVALEEEQRKMASEVNKLRGVMLGKLDGLQGTMDLLRLDVHNSWGTADFAIRNASNVRDDTDKILNLMSTMQKQQQLLASQVEVLRRAAAEKDSGA